MPDEKSELDKETKPVAPAVKPADAAAPAKPVVAAAARPAAPPAPPKPAPIAWESELVTALKRQYGSGIREAASYLKDKYLVVDKSIVFDVLTHLRDEQQFDYCVDLTAVNWPKRYEHFDVV